MRMFFDTVEAPEQHHRVIIRPLSNVAVSHQLLGAAYTPSHSAVFVPPRCVWVRHD